MAVKTENVENAERDLELVNRAGTVVKGTARAPEPEAQLLALRQRILAGLNKVGDDPRPTDAPVCRACFQRGWIAALRSLEP